MKITVTLDEIIPGALRALTTPENAVQSKVTTMRTKGARGTKTKVEGLSLVLPLKESFLIKQAKEVLKLKLPNFSVVSARVVYGRPTDRTEIECVVESVEKQKTADGDKGKK